MPSTRTLARAARTAYVPAVLLAVLAAAMPAARAQDAEPGAEPPASGEPAKPRPKPKPKPVPRAAPRPEAKSEAKPEAKSEAKPEASPEAGPAPAVWPAGASSVSETYGDWTMSCTRAEEKTACIVVQSQGDAKTGRRKFGIELQAPREGRAEGVILMPFGLAIEPGVTFKLDEQTLGKGAPYSICNGEGCLVPISFPKLATDGMRNAKTLTVTAQKPGGTEPAAIVVPLVGFPQAFDRALALGG